MRLRETVGGLLGRKRASTGDAVLDTLLPLLLKNGGGGLLGGLSGVLGSFARAGLGQKADSWVATGAKEELTADEVERVFGLPTVARLAAKAAVPPGVAATRVAAILPRLIDQLTPGGTVPPGGLAKAASTLDIDRILGGSAR